MSTRLISLLIGAIFGSIPSGMIIARLKGVDLAHTGSGNVGSTNVLRTMGKGFGALTLALDMLKAVIPILLTGYIFGTGYLTLLYTGTGAVLGHDFSPWLHFKGGKGVATSGGMVMMTDPVIFVIDLVTIFGTAVLTGYVSAGSMLATLFYFCFNVCAVLAYRIPGWPGYKHGFKREDALEILVLSAFVSLLCIYRHKDNIKRLAAGTENKIKLI